MDKKPNAKALLPIAVFLVLYLGCGIYFEYIAPTEGQMGFYVVSVVVAFVIALIVALLQNRSLSFDEKIHVCARGIGDDNIVIMLFIFLMAGAFSGIASAAGGAESTANLFLDILPAQAAIPGLFVIAFIKDAVIVPRTPRLSTENPPVFPICAILPLPFPRRLLY